jgi:hypothetical protein
VSLEDDEITGLLETLSNLQTCNWYKHPREAVFPKIGLCSHCNRIRTGLKKLEKEAAAFQQKHGGISYPMMFDLMVQRQMVKQAQAEGHLYGNIFTDEITGLDLEHELDLLGKRYVKKEFFGGYATLFGHSFCPNHRRYVYYILSLFNREYMRKNRRKIAMARVSDEVIRFC